MRAFKGFNKDLTCRGVIQRVVHFVRKDVPLFYIFSKNPPQK